MPMSHLQSGEIEHASVTSALYAVENATIQPDKKFITSAINRYGLNILGKYHILDYINAESIGSPTEDSVFPLCTQGLKIQVQDERCNEVRLN